MDIDKRLNPDVTGSVLNIPFSNDTFEVVVCCELLEHLPYRNFKTAISEIFRVSNSYALISCPDVNRVCCLYVQIPGIRDVRKIISLPRLRKTIHHFDGQHYWEIGKAGYSLNRIITTSIR